MSIQTELARIKGAKADLQSWVEENGVTVPDGTLIDGLVELAKTVETGGGADISPWSDMVTFSITPAEDLTGDIDFTSFIPGRTSIPDIFILGQRAKTSDSSYVQSMVRMSTWNSWSMLYYEANSGTGRYPNLSIENGILKVKIGTYKLEAGVLYWGAMLWR